MAFYITKRRLTRAVNLALENQTIPDSPYRFYSIEGKYPEYGICWPEKNLVSAIHRREDNTIYICHAARYEEGSLYEGWINESIWEGPSK